MAAAAASLATPAGALAAGQPPAAGAGIGQVIGATAGATIATLVLLWVINAHRSGRIQWLGRLAGVAERLTGLPSWASIPATVLGASLLVAVFGMYWDISLHLDNGRDPGPLANPAHYFILVGLFGVFVCGALTLALPRERPSNVAKNFATQWWAPLGGILILVCSAVSLLAFPLDDIWHRLFGQDVTLWGPTHLLLFGGASLSIIGLWVLQVEGAKETGHSPVAKTPLQRFRDLSLAGSLLVGMSTFQGEFDFGVPQFRLVWQPVLLALAAGIALVTARVRLGRGGALAGVVFFIGLRGFLALMVGPILGQTTPHFPLYIVEGLCVELVGLRFGRRRPIALGAVSGLLIGTLGFAGEFGWSHVWGYNPWPASLLPEAIPCAIVAGLAGGVLGGFIGRSITPETGTERYGRWAIPLAAAAVVGLVVWCVPMPVPSNPPSATVALRNIPSSGSTRKVSATIQLHPANAAKHKYWLTVTAWQGHGAVVDRLKEIGPGKYRTTQAIPVSGPKWKSTLRLARGREVLGLPLYMPADSAIPVKGIPAPAQFTRPFERDKKLLQREQKPGVSPFLTTFAYLIVLAIGLAVIALLTWGLRSISREIGSLPPPRRRRPQASPRVAPAPGGGSVGAAS
ncbi:MAG: hypothetical protein JOZ25_03450 [Actinobacteria bacterium]|nr:hypothetical protein [Actinomycetota bacterium]